MYFSCVYSFQVWNMECKLAEFRARKKAQKPADRVIQRETKALSDGSPAVCPDTPEQKPNTCPQSPHTQVWELLWRTRAITKWHINLQIKPKPDSVFPCHFRITVIICWILHVFVGFSEWPSPIWPWLKCCCGSCCWGFFQNLSSACHFLLYRYSTGSMRAFEAQEPDNLEKWVRILCLTLIVNPSWEL